MQALCEQFNISPQQVVIELTESMLAEDASVFLDILTRFRLKGFELSIDDFGTGYSSFEQLKSLPFTELKIDKSFVLDVMHNEASRHIVQNNVGLGNAMNLRLVAEGVEDAQTVEFLRDINCHTLQGYHIAKPLPADDFQHWLMSEAYVA